MRLLILPFLTFIILLTTSSCKEICGYENIPKCNESLPKNEYCDAYFEKWFYNKENNSCSLIQYSGCNEYGFATQSECETCLCSKGKKEEKTVETNPVSMIHESYTQLNLKPYK